jgi:hypothetical protein
VRPSGNLGQELSSRELICHGRDFFFPVQGGDLGIPSDREQRVRWEVGMR